MAKAEKKAAPAKSKPVKVEKTEKVERNYDKVEYLDANGKKKRSVGNGDAIFTAMRGLSEKEVVQVAKQNGLGDLVKKHHGNSNAGRFRMMIGNSLRALVRKGTAVEIAGQKVKALDQSVKAPKLGA